MKLIFTVILCLCSFISAQCDEGEIDLIWNCNDYLSNHSDGCMPSGCYSIQNTTHLSISNTPLGDLTVDSKIPSEVGSLINLEFLKFQNCSFEGEIPSEMENLINLVTFELLSNQLSGSIPAWIGNLSNLQNFTIASNNFSVTYQ